MKKIIILISIMLFVSPSHAADSDSVEEIKAEAEAAVRKAEDAKVAYDDALFNANKLLNVEINAETAAYDANITLNAAKDALDNATPSTLADKQYAYDLALADSTAANNAFNEAAQETAAAQATAEALGEASDLAATEAAKVQDEANQISQLAEETASNTSSGEADLKKAAVIAAMAANTLDVNENWNELATDLTGAETLTSASSSTEAVSPDNANLDQLLSMNSLDDYSVEEHIMQTFDMGCAGFDKLSVIKGECTWLKCGFLYCNIKISAIVRHRSPDLLVEVSASDKDSVIEPLNWIDGAINDLGELFHKLVGLNVGVIKGGIKGTNRSKKKTTDNYNTFDVSIIGNPYILLYETALGTVMESLEIGSFCYSDATPFVPYFTTKTSPEWRFGLGERLNSLGDTASFDTRNINNYGYHLDMTDPANSLSASMGIHWGYLYPRMGFAKSKSLYRSAALMAQRAMSISSYNNGDDGGINLHIPTYGTWPPTDMSSRAGRSYGIFPFKEHDNKHDWQLNYPQGKRPSGCYRFPDVQWDGADYINGVYPKKIIGSETVQTGTRTEVVEETYFVPGAFGSMKKKTRFIENEIPIYEQRDITEDITSNNTAEMMEKVDLPSDSNTYIFTLWRTYQCCSDKGTFLFDIKW